MRQFCVTYASSGFVNFLVVFLYGVGYVVSHVKIAQKYF